MCVHTLRVYENVSQKKKIDKLWAWFVNETGRITFAINWFSVVSLRFLCARTLFSELRTAFATLPTVSYLPPATWLSLSNLHPFQSISHIKKSFFRSLPVCNSGPPVISRLSSIPASRLQLVYVFCRSLSPNPSWKKQFHGWICKRKYPILLEGNAQALGP